MGNIYDNFLYAEISIREIEFTKSGSLREIHFIEIDLTIRLLENDFKGAKFQYPYYGIRDWADMIVSEKRSGEIHSEAFTTNYKGKNIMFCSRIGIMQNQREGEDYRRVWIRIRSYFYEKGKKSEAAGSGFQKILTDPGCGRNE